MNTLKITNKKTGETYTVKYPNAFYFAKAKYTLLSISQSRNKKINVPCDIQTGKEQKLIDTSIWSVK